MAICLELLYLSPNAMFQKSKMLGLGKVFFKKVDFNREIGFLIPEVIFSFRIEDHFFTIFPIRCKKNLKDPELRYVIDGTSVHTYLRYGPEIGSKMVCLFWVDTQVWVLGFAQNVTSRLNSPKMNIHNRGSF